MNILFLIGNGFDLNVGLKTRFKDVAESYLREETADSRIKRFKKDIASDIDDWSDFEKQLGIYTEKYTNEEIDDFCFCIRHFRAHLIEHLKNEEAKISYSAYQSKITKIFGESIGSFYKGLNDSEKNLFEGIIERAYERNEDISYSFITFNYTEVLDKCLSFVDEVGIKKILHIHGNINKNPVLGVDNNSQIKNTGLASNKKIGRTVVKPSINDSLKNGNNADAKNLIVSSDIICLFGLSLGETDKTWWKFITQVLIKNSQKQLIIFNLVEDWNPIHPDEEIERIDQTEEKFYNAADLSDVDRRSIAERVHIGLNTDLFKLDLVSLF